MAETDASKRTKEIGLLLRRLVDQVQPIVDQFMADVVAVDQGLLPSEPASAASSLH